MRAVLVIVTAWRSSTRRRCRSFKMRRRSVHSDPTVRTQRSATAFALGTRMGLRTMLAPVVGAAHSSSSISDRRPVLFNGDVLWVGLAVGHGPPRRSTSTRLSEETVRSTSSRRLGLRRARSVPPTRYSSASAASVVLASATSLPEDRPGARRMSTAFRSSSRNTASR